MSQGPVPAWVVQRTDAPSTTTAGEQDGLRILFFDSQFRAEADQQSLYIRTRTAALSPQALTVLGNLALTWSPASEDIIVHHVSIIRDGQTIDVLANQAFETLRREANLEQAMLDGQLTASLQPSGLRVGDILDFDYTVVSRDPVVAGHGEQRLDLNLPVAIDQIHYRGSWPTTMNMRLRAADDWIALPVRREGGQSVVDISLNDAQPIVVPDDVPMRLRGLRSIELSDYRDWGDVANALKPLYDRTRRLEDASPLKAEIERIRALSDDPAVQASAALRLVQDQVRYVALLMGEGALVPATADQTWDRRFGDCKAKTVLLLALLDGLGIQAEPATVSILNGDGMDGRLPMVSAFDHVVVRATIGGTVYWLDGTRTGNRSLADVAVPGFHWALPLSGPEARLERLVVPPKTVPDSETTLAVDASAGLYAPAAVTGTMILRGDAAALLGGQIGLISGAQKDQGLRSIWLGQLTAPTITEVGSTYDPEANVLTLTMNGTMSLTWSSDGMLPPGATYRAITTEDRPEGPFHDAPYAIAHPAYSIQTATLRLPEGGRGFRVSGGQVDLTELGHHLQRTVRLDGDLLTVEISARSLTDEITAAEADSARAAALARPYNPPRIFSPTNYSPSAGDREAWQADAPTTADAWLDRAMALSQAGDNTGALAAAEEAVALSPENSTTLANRGIYRFLTGDHEGAKADLDKASDIDPSERIAMNGHALIAMDEGNYEDAVIELSRALRQAPGDDFALSTRAQAYVAMEQYDRALRDVDTLIAAEPANIRLQAMRASVLEAAGRHEEADQILSDIAEANPALRTAIRSSQVELRLKRGDAQGALDLLDAEAAATTVTTRDTSGPDEVVVVTSTDIPDLRLEALLALGRLDEATTLMTAMRDGQPDADTLNNLCWTAATAGVLLDQALADCDAALALAPDSAAILDTKGRLLLQRGDPAGALALYDRALASSPRLAASLYGRGLALIALGRTEEGELSKAQGVERSRDVADSFTHYAPVATAPTP